MKRKDINALRLKNILTKDKKISDIYQKLKLILSEHRKKNLFVIAVSGGPDSMSCCLSKI